jgi:type VI secretion system protein ImpJ
MQHLPVHWTEGLFLTAQHFQAADRHWQELLFRGERFDQAYYYGLRKVHLSDEAIKNSAFQLDACEARTRLGTIVSLGEGSEPDRISLKEALAGGPASNLRSDLTALLASRRTVRIYLAIPKLRLGSANVGQRGSEGLHRYVELPAIALQDESTGGNDQEVAFKLQQVKIIVKGPRHEATDGTGVVLFDDDDPNYDLLPIAQVRRAGEGGPELDKSYIPPILAIDAWSELQDGIVRNIYDRIGVRIERLSQQVVARRIAFASQDPGDLDRILMLMRLNEAYAALSVITFASGVHPLAAYVALVKIVGQLAIFDPSRRPPAIPKYDHDDLGTIFRWVRDQIFLYLDLTPDLPYFHRPFIGQGLGMQVTFDPDWLGPHFKWYIGVQYHQITAAQCRNLLAPNALHWKLGSVKQVEGMFQGGRPGLQLVPQEPAPKELPATDRIFFEVTRSGDAWQDVLVTQTLAMRYKDALVDNRETLEGQEKLVIHVPPKKVELQFGLFVVPSRP